MLPWQREHIQKNLEHLVHIDNLELNNKVIEILLKTKELDSSAFNIFDKKNGQVNRLYNTLQFSSKGYETLTKALYECNEVPISSDDNIPLNILLNGFQIHEIRDPLTQCGISVNYSTVRSGEVLAKDNNLSDCILKVEDVFSEKDLGNFEEVMQSNNLEYEYIDTFITKTKKLALPDTIPQAPSFYISRYISNRLKVNPEIFKRNVEDVFVFKGLERFALSHLLDSQETTTSTSLLHETLHGNQSNYRFILLDDDNHWQEIQNKCKTPIHLIKAEVNANKTCTGAEQGTKYILQETSDYQKLLQWLQEEAKEEKVYEREDEFVRKIADKTVTSSGICICDTPGMGKTYLLASLARKIQQLHTDRVILFIRLKHFSEFLSRKQKFIQMNPNTALNMVLEFVSSSKMILKMLERALTKGRKTLELFLDGLDELSFEDDLYLTKRFLKAIAKFQTGRGRVYVTSRPNLREDLEKTLEVVAYDILPFSRENQREYLVESWKEKCKTEETNDNKSNLTSKLQAFAECCLYKIKSTVPESDIMGLPLKCFLLSEVHEKCVKVYLNQKNSQLKPMVGVNSVYGLFTKYVSKRKESCRNLEHVEKFHMWKALDIFGFFYANTYAKLKHLNTNFSDEYFSFGLLTKTNGNIHFIHRTFAEYLVTLCFVDLLKGNKGNESAELWAKCLELLGTKIMFIWKPLLEKFECPKSFPSYISRGRFTQFEVSKFSNRVLPYFLNEYLRKNFIVPSTNLAETPLAKFLFENVYNNLLCCAHDSFSYILRFIKECYLEKGEGKQIFKDYYVISTTKDNMYGGTVEKQENAFVLLYFFASRMSSLEVIKELEELLKMCDYNLDKVQLAISDNILLTPLQVATERGNYDMFEYYKNKFPYKPKELLRWCTHHSVDEDSIIEEKLQICNFLMKEMRSISIVEWDKALEDAIYEKNVHPDIIRLLLKSRTTDYLSQGSKSLIAHASMSDRPEKLDKLCSYLIQDNKTLYFKQEMLPLDKLIRYIIDQPKNVLADHTLLKILEQAEVSFNTVNKRLKKDKCLRNDLLQTMVKRNRGLDLLKAVVLVKDVLDCKYTNSFGESALHLAAKTGNVEVVLFLHRLGFKLNKCDSSGNAPLLLAKDLGMIKCLLTLGAKITHKNKYKENIAHIFLDQYTQESQTVIDEFIRYVLENFSKYVSSLFNKVSREGLTPLHFLFERFIPSGQRLTSTQEQLLKRMPKINMKSKNDEGYNLFLSAIKAGEPVRILEILVNHGAKIEAIVKSKKRNALHIFSVKSYRNFDEGLSVLKYLLSFKKIDVNAKDAYGQFPLIGFMPRYVSDTEKFKRITDVLLKHGASINTCDNEGNNVLFLGTRFSRDLEVSKYLIEKGAKLDGENANGDNILHIAAKHGRVSSLRYFLSISNDLDVNKKNREERTPLLNAVTYTSHENAVKDMVTILYEMGADMNAVGKDTKNVFNLAEDSNLSDKIIQQLNNFKRLQELQTPRVLSEETPSMRFNGF